MNKSICLLFNRASFAQLFSVTLNSARRSFHTNIPNPIIIGEYGVFSKALNHSKKKNNSNNNPQSLNSFKAFLYSSTASSTGGTGSTSDKHYSSPILNYASLQIDSTKKTETTTDNMNKDSVLFIDPTSGIPIVFRRDGLQPFPMNTSDEAVEEIMLHNFKFLINNTVLKESDMMVRLCELWMEKCGDATDEHHSMLLLGQYLKKIGLDEATLDEVLNQVDIFNSKQNNRSLSNSFFSEQHNVAEENYDDENDEHNLDKLLTTFKAYPYIQIEDWP